MLFLSLDPWSVVYCGAAAVSFLACCIVGLEQYRRKHWQDAPPVIDAGLFWSVACMLGAALVLLILCLGFFGPEAGS